MSAVENPPAFPSREEIACVIINRVRADHYLPAMSWYDFTRLEQEKYLKQADAVLALAARSTGEAQS